MSTLIFLTGLWTVLGKLMQGATLSLVSSDVHNGNHNSQRWLCVGILKKSHTNGTPFQGPLGFKPPRPPGGGGPAAPRAPCSILERLRLSSSPFFLVPRSWYQDLGTRILVPRSLGEPVLHDGGTALSLYPNQYPFFIVRPPQTSLVGKK